MNNSTKELRGDMKEAAATLKWAGVDLFGVADRMLAEGDEQGANALVKIARSFQKVEEKLEGCPEQTTLGRINPGAGNIR